MRTYVLLGALLGLAQIPAVAQDVVNPNGQSIQGTWISQVADATGAIALFEVGTFSPDGSYSGANVTPTHTEHKGVWLRTGDRKFVLTVMFFHSRRQECVQRDYQSAYHPDPGGRPKVIRLRRGARCNGCIGKELSVTPGIAGHAVRMNVEFPKNPPPQ